MRVLIKNAVHCRLISAYALFRGVLGKNAKIPYLQYQHSLAEKTDPVCSKALQKSLRPILNQPSAVFPSSVLSQGSLIIKSLPKNNISYCIIQESHDRKPIVA